MVTSLAEQLSSGRKVLFRSGKASMSNRAPDRFEERSSAEMKDKPVIPQANRIPQANHAYILVFTMDVMAARHNMHKFTMTMRVSSDVKDKAAILVEKRSILTAQHHW